MLDRKWIEDGILEALERADRELRGKYARKFQKVDRIKRQPGWAAWWVRVDGACRKCGSSNWYLRPDKGRTCRPCHAERQRRRKTG